MCDNHRQTGVTSREWVRDADEISRSELQEQLRFWGLSATGTNAALRTRYTNERDKRILASSPTATAPRSSGTSSMPTKSSSCSAPFATAMAASLSKPVETLYQPNKKSVKKPPQEKRLKRFRSNCPNAVKQRIARARTQRLFLVKRGEIQGDLRCEFVILGSTGNVYTVVIQKLPSCSCPDHAKGNLCKHILFVLLKVMSLDPNSPLIYQAAWLESELILMFSQMRNRLRHVSGASSSVMANEAVRATFAKLEKGEVIDDNDDEDVHHAKRKAVEEDDCPICYDAMTKSDATTFCRARCGANFHQVCIQGWLRQQGRNATCPMCREPWEEKTCGKVSSPEGYTNLGRLQGQQADRDTSTYSTWSSPYSRYRRRRYY